MCLVFEGEELAERCRALARPEQLQVSEFRRHPNARIFGADDDVGDMVPCFLHFLGGGRLDDGRLLLVRRCVQRGIAELDQRHLAHVHCNGQQLGLDALHVFGNACDQLIIEVAARRYFGSARSKSSNTLSE